MNGNTERAQCALSLVCIPQEMGKKGSKKNKKVLSTACRHWGVFEDSDSEPEDAFLPSA